MVIGRGGRSYWVDLRLETLPDVSREHCQIRRDPATGKFFIKDLSTFGTTVGGARVPSSDHNVEAALPAKASIHLADVITIQFKALKTK